MDIHSQQPHVVFLREEGEVSKMESVHFAAGQKSIIKIRQDGQVSIVKKRNHVVFNHITIR